MDFTVSPCNWLWLNITLFRKSKILEDWVTDICIFKKCLNLNIWSWGASDKNAQYLDMGFDNGSNCGLLSLYWVLSALIKGQWSSSGAFWFLKLWSISFAQASHFTRVETVATYLWLLTGNPNYWCNPLVTSIPICWSLSHLIPFQDINEPHWSHSMYFFWDIIKIPESIWLCNNISRPLKV